MLNDFQSADWEPFRQGRVFMSKHSRPTHLPNCRTQWPHTTERRGRPGARRSGRCGRSSRRRHPVIGRKRIDSWWRSKPESLDPFFEHNRLPLKNLRNKSKMKCMVDWVLFSLQMKATRMRKKYRSFIRLSLPLPPSAEEIGKGVEAGKQRKRGTGWGGRLWQALAPRWPQRWGPG